MANDTNMENDPEMEEGNGTETSGDAFSDENMRDMEEEDNQNATNDEQ